MEIIKAKEGFLSILGGKTDMGKSTIACYDCAHELRAGKNVMFFSYEYCQSIVYNKLVTHFDFKFAELFNLNVVDARGWSFNQLKDAIMNNKDHVEVVYIDFLDLLIHTTFSDAENDTDAQKVENKQKLVSELARIAYELHISIVILTRLRTKYTLDDSITFLNLITSTITTPLPAIKMFIGKDEALNPMIKGTDMSHVIEIEGNELRHFSSINLKQAYKD